MNHSVLFLAIEEREVCLTCNIRRQIIVHFVGELIVSNNVVD